jgi:UDP-glucose 4-epimerase
VQGLCSDSWSIATRLPAIGSGRYCSPEFGRDALAASTVDLSRACAALAVYSPHQSWDRHITHCLIVGGGFIGAPLAERLAREGHCVTIYSRSFNERLALGSGSPLGQIRLVEGEVPPGAGLLELVSEAEIVFYLAGTSTPAAASTDPGGSMARHVVPAAAVLELMRETSTRRIVLASSGGTVYGVPKLPTPEDYPTRPISLHGHHSLTIERYAQFFAERHGFETIVLRYSNPYGPHQIARRGQAVVAAWSEALARDEPLLMFGDPQTRRDFVFIDDLVEATALAGLHAPAGTYNVGSGVATPLQEVADLLVAAARRKPEIVHADARPVDVPVTQLDCSRLRSATGWRPAVSLPDGILASWEWMVKTDHLAIPHGLHTV